MFDKRGHGVKGSFLLAPRYFLLHLQVWLLVNGHLQTDLWLGLGDMDVDVMVAVCGARSMVLGVQMCHRSLNSSSTVFFRDLASPPL